jgi:hypothetical protein
VEAPATTPANEGSTFTQLYNGLVEKKHENGKKESRLGTRWGKTAWGRESRSGEIGKEMMTSAMKI